LKEKNEPINSLNMETAQTKSMIELLTELTNSQTYELPLSDGNSYKFKQLNANHLKELIETVVDTSLTQNTFNDTCNRIFKQCLVESSAEQATFNILDRLLFVIESRIQSISPIVTIKDSNQTSVFDLLQIKENIITTIKQTPDLFTEKQYSGNGIEIVCSLPTLSIDSQLNDDLEKQNKLDVTNESSVRKLLGDAFINELAKSIRFISIQENKLDLATLPFGERVKTVEMLPASLINNVVSYIEAYKNLVESYLRVNGNTLTIDGSLFSIR
jgi:hypothetical protein